jgi:hypothetical protein
VIARADAARTQSIAGFDPEICGLKPQHLDLCSGSRHTRSTRFPLFSERDAAAANKRGSCASAAISGLSRVAACGAGLLCRRHAAPEASVVIKWLLDHLDGSLFSVAVVALAVMKVRVRIRRGAHGSSIDVQVGSRRWDR